MKAEQVQEGIGKISLEDFSISHEVVMKNVRALFQLQKKILDFAQVRATLQKIRDWMLGFSGNNEEGVTNFF